MPFVALGTYVCCSKRTSQNNPETTEQLTESQITFKLMDLFMHKSPGASHLQKLSVFEREGVLEFKSLTLKAKRQSPKDSTTKVTP